MSHSRARRSLGIAVISGMLASTCLAVLFVPSFYVVLQRFAEGRKGRQPAPRDAEIQAEHVTH